MRDAAETTETDPPMPKCVFFGGVNKLIAEESLISDNDDDALPQISAATVASVLSLLEPSITLHGDRDRVARGVAACRGVRFWEILPYQIASVAADGDALHVLWYADCAASGADSSCASDIWQSVGGTKIYHWAQCARVNPDDLHTVDLVRPIDRDDGDEHPTIDDGYTFKTVQDSLRWSDADWDAALARRGDDDTDVPRGTAIARAVVRSYSDDTLLHVPNIVGWIAGRILANRQGKCVVTDLNCAGLAEAIGCHVNQVRVHIVSAIRRGHLVARLQRGGDQVVLQLAPAMDEPIGTPERTVGPTWYGDAEWSIWQSYTNAEGDHLAVRSCKPTQTFLHLWSLDKSALQAYGNAVRKDADGQWLVIQLGVPTPHGDYVIDKGAANHAAVKT